MIKIRTMKASGLTDAQIVSLIECHQEEQAATKREQARIRKRNQRARHAFERDMKNEPEKMQKAEQNQHSCHAFLRDVTLDSVTLQNPNEINGHVTLSGVTKSPHTPLTQNQRRVLCPINTEWRPNSNGLLLADKAGLAGEDLEREIERFRNYYLSKGTELQDWNPCWANWLTSPFRKGKPNGQAQSTDRRERELSRWEEAYAKLDQFARGCSAADPGYAVAFQACEGD